MDVKNKTIVCIGGGTGLFSILSGLKKYVDTDTRTLKAIVSTLDNGGSSGKLITQYGVLPPGDIRNCIVALSEESHVLNELFQYRFDEGLDKHNFGNLLITALTELMGSFDDAVKEASKILRVKGEVIPVSLDNNSLCAKFNDGSSIEGESQITKAKKTIQKLYLKEKYKANQRAVDAIKKADLIIFGPGSLYTSILPNLLYENLREEINKNTSAKKILIINVMSEEGETTGFKVSDFKRTLEEYLKGRLTHIVANTKIPTKDLLDKYFREENKSQILLDEENIFECEIISGDYIDEDKIIRHNPEKLAERIVKLID